MNEELKQKIEALYRELLELPMAVTEIFNDFYGEERVDLQPISLEEFIYELGRTEMHEIVGGGLSTFAESSYMRSHRDDHLIVCYSYRMYSHVLTERFDIFD